MSTTDHVTVPLTSDGSDNFQFMSDTFTLSQNDQTNPTQIPINQGFTTGSIDH